jgi:N-acetylneuraminic acid mutarotase
MKRYLVVLATVAAACHSAPPHDPGTGPGTWTLLHPLDEERFEAAAVTLDGKVYFMGGITDVCPDHGAACTVDRVDVYDPVADVWSAAPPLPAAAPRHHLALAVVGSSIYVLGGFTGIIGGADNFTPISATFAFDGTTWTRLADAPMARGAATAQAIGGKIYVAGGGIAEPNALSFTAVYDPAIDRWSSLAPMPTAREHVASCVLGDQFVVIGGWRSDDSVVSAVEAYDPSTNGWRTLSPLRTARGGLGAAVLDGTCYAVGGEDWVSDGPGTFPDVQGLSALDGVWTTFAPMPRARHGIGVAVVGQELTVIGGGPTRANSYTQEVDAFVP